MDPIGIEWVQVEPNEEHHNIYTVMREEFREERKVMTTVMTEALQEERKVSQVNYLKMLNLFHEKNVQVHQRIDNLEESMNERISHLEDNFTGNKQSFQQQLHEKEKVETCTCTQKFSKTRLRKSRRAATLRENKCCSLTKPNSSSHTLCSSTPPDMRRTRTAKRDLNTAKNSCQESNGGVAESGNRIRLTERELQALMKGINCVSFIGRLVLASFPKRYFLEKKNNFSVAISSQHIDALFEIVSSKYKEIKRNGQPPKLITKAEVTKVIKMKVTNFRSSNRHMIK
uniref:BEN domain-containing protein n=1 Tax=Daphnia galeata TaxID=27404 RepID=A0A8J2RPG1_9CRUS|nr:unnamed protein product [Daphnia galeata]